MGNCGLALVGLIGSLKDDRPDEVLTILGIVVWSHVTEFSSG
jgi:hypothetical protein